MNSQLPPLPPPDPLDDEERGLARALRGLPSSMPSPELDARILGASRRAIAIAPKPRAIRPRWVLGLSSAAVAVLAVGMLLKLHTQGRDQAIAPPTQAPAAAQPTAAAQSPAVAQPVPAYTAAAPTAADAAAAANLPPSLPDIEAMAPIRSGPVVTAAKAVGTLHAAAPPDRDERQAAKITVPPSSAPGTVAPPDITPSAQSASNTARTIAEPFPINQPSQQTAVAPSPAPAISAAASQPVASPLAPPPETTQLQAAQEAVDARKAAALDRIDLAGARLKDSEPAALPAVDDDAKLPPAEWIQRIRARVNAADGDGARASLRRFIARYPHAEIPPDLAPLRSK